MLRKKKKCGIQTYKVNKNLIQYNDLSKDVYSSEEWIKLPTETTFGMLFKTKLYKVKVVLLYGKQNQELSGNTLQTNILLKVISYSSDG